MHVRLFTSCRWTDVRLALSQREPQSLSAKRGQPPAELVRRGSARCRVHSPVEPTTLGGTLVRPHSHCFAHDQPVFPRGNEAPGGEVGYGL